MTKPPRIEAVEVLGPTQLRVQWTTGECLEVDLAEPISRLQALAPLRDPAVFAQVQIGEWGHSLMWSNEIDLGADRLYERSKEQAGELSPRQFDAWMRNHHLSLTTAAEALGISRRMVAHYRTGSRPIPKIVGLACKGWEAGRASAPLN
jgi:DNA-binding CsgD family transcriptional regulator